MQSPIDRRGFLAVSFAAGASLAMGEQLDAALRTTTLRKARIGAPSKQDLTKWKAAGFEGVEWTNWRLSPPEIAAARQTVESLGMRIHSVLFGWGNLNGGDVALTDGVLQMEAALRAARAFGAETVLYVPCKIGGMPMPEAREFDIRFDDKTGHLKQVVAGDNANYRKYIESHDHAVDATREAIKMMIPTAEKTDVIIALENVTNYLWVKPDIWASFVASFQSPWVKAYFDIANHVEYAPPQDWIHAMSKLLVKCHVKDFKFNSDGHGGDECNIRDGCVNWLAVRKALDDIGYNGWMTIEGGDLSLNEESKRLDLIIAGK